MTCTATRGPRSDQIDRLTETGAFYKMTHHKMTHTRIDYLISISALDEKEDKINYCYIWIGIIRPTWTWT